MPCLFHISHLYTAVYVAPFYEKQKFIVPANSPLYFCYVLVYCFGEQIQHLFFSIVHFSLCVQCAHVCVSVCVYTDYRYVLFGSTSLTETIYYKKREIVNQNVCVCVCAYTCGITH